jgi:hypothetical protein
VVALLLLANKEIKRPELALAIYSVCSLLSPRRLVCLRAFSAF